MTKNMNDDESGHKISCFHLSLGFKKGAMRCWRCHPYNRSTKTEPGPLTLIKDFPAFLYMHFGLRDFNPGMLVTLQFRSPYVTFLRST